MCPQGLHCAAGRSQGSWALSVPSGKWVSTLEMWAEWDTAYLSARCMLWPPRCYLFIPPAVQLGVLQPLS